MHSYQRIAAGILIGLAAAGAAQAQKSPEPADPYLWLEDVAGDKPLSWVKARNAVAQQELEGRPQFASLHERIKTVMNARERIPYVNKIGQYYYNFWNDDKNVRGVWRRTTLEEFRKTEPKWETVIDLDQLARDEKENWVWSGVSCLQPKGERCLVSMSRGGGDAHVTREYDVVKRAFVQGGFELPEAKSTMSWIDADTVFVETDFGPGTMTTSGYPRIVKEWKRGTPLSEARTVLEAKTDDMSVGAWKDFTPGHEHQFVERRMTFWTGETFWRGADGKLVKIDKPDDANTYTIRDQLVVELRSEWKVGGKTYPQGALLAMDFKRFLKGERDFFQLFTPTPTRSIASVAHTRNAVLVNEMDNVKNRIVEWTRADGKWVRRDVNAPAFGTLSLYAVDPIDSDDYFLTVTDFLTPSTLYLAHAGSDKRERLKAMPSFFDSTPYTVTQYFATSKDGTKVPYFIVMGKDTKFDGKNPTLLYGYGGYEISMKPSYSGIIGEGWLKHGGVYVLSNIRGGGEFGPRWHQAALKENRQKAYDDFIAIAEDLIARKITSPRHLGIMGGSNGGLLVSAVMVQRPDLFNAVVCQVPLTDMRRFNQLLAGASWMGEYGNPDDPKQWEYISKYSPYHNLSKDKKYPRILFTTSTRDDRVHPAHARKMAALMQEQGHDVLYWENIEGGHAGAANNNQKAQMWSLTYTFLLNQLK
ncbi:MAG TPA: prolyl oligopeptidase family serine peptidase [Paucimonas sp.]|nr:prolyl oligopeptidase family serine peptidase [Paucimonas sp.]